MPVVQADDREDGWQEFQELLDFEVFLLDCKLLNDDMVGFPSVILLTVELHSFCLCLVGKLSLFLLDFVSMFDRFIFIFFLVLFDLFFDSLHN